MNGETMHDNRHDNPSVFPVGHDGGHQGMSLRDYFAIKMAAATVASIGGRVVLTDAAIAQAAYLFADAMLAEREKKP